MKKTPSDEKRMPPPATAWMLYTSGVLWWGEGCFYSSDSAIEHATRKFGYCPSVWRPIRVRITPIARKPRRSK